MNVPATAGTAGAARSAPLAVLHVGMSKCGSSALQTVLSLQPELTPADSGMPAARYVVLPKDGALVTGEEIGGIARRVPCGYAISARAHDLDAMGCARIALLRRELARTAGDGARLVLSNEGWAQEYAEFTTGRFLERLELDCTVLIYVRPQVEWCNAAWWQWGAWTGLELPRWVERQHERMQWSRVVEGWRCVPGVRDVHVRLLPPGIVEDFCATVGVASPGEVVANRSLPGVVLRVFQRHRRLRPGAHDSDIEFAIARHLELPRSRTPWVMPQEVVERVIASCHESNLELLAQLDPEQRERMRADAAWWDAAHFAPRRLLPWQARPPVPQDVDQLAAVALEAVHRLDARCRELEHALARERNRPWWRRWFAPAGAVAQEAGNDGAPG